MNKMAKGALAIGVGAALLLGGGGTLAVWNQSVSTTAGTIAAGELGLTADAGVWTNSVNEKVDIASYKIVPGETLTYTQDLNVTLKGDRILAKVSLDSSGIAAKAAASGATFNPNDFDLQMPTLTKTDGTALPETLTPKIVDDLNGKVRASAKIGFKSTTSGVSSSGSVASFGAITYKLDQQVALAPSATQAPTAK